MKRQWPYILLAFLAPSLLILWWWGLFASVQVEMLPASTFRYAYLEAKGPYSKHDTTRGEVERALQAQGIVPRQSLTLIYDDPRTTPADQRHARVGFVIEPGAVPAAPLLADTTPGGQVLQAHVKAHPIFAYGKVYGALLDYTERHDMRLRMPVLEIYDASVLTVAMPMENQP